VNSNFFISDYVSLRPDWFGTIDVFALPLNGVKMVMWAYKSFSVPNNDYPPGFADHMNRYRDELMGASSSPVVADFEVVGGSHIQVNKSEYPKDWFNPDLMDN
jgi:hypothetical protein